MRNNLKNFSKKIEKILLVLVACLLVITTVNAASAPSKLTVSAYDKKSTSVKWPSTFHVKKTANGQYVYCTYVSKSTPRNKIKFTLDSEVTDNGINYILNEAVSAKNDDEYFIYQTALWVYMVDKGIMPGSTKNVDTFKKTLSKSTSTAATKIKNVVAAAKKASKNDTSAPTIQINTNGIKFDVKDGYYVSSPIKISSSTGKYGVKLTEAPDGTKYDVNGDSLVIKVLASKVSDKGTTVKLTVDNSKTIYRTYKYNPSSSKYQTLDATFSDTLTSKASAVISVQKKTTSISIIKVDSENGKAVEGAGLQVIDSNGAVKDSWSSTTSAHVVSGLTQGTYTLKEISEPSGYKLSNVAVKFTVKEDGTVVNSNGSKITEIKYSNEETSVIISKQDITSKAEVPGAHLVIKDSNNVIMAEWTSSEKKTEIKLLPAGTYTLTETIAPDGYTKSSEVITFKIDKYGKIYNGKGEAVDYIVMYNEKTPKTPTSDVHISKSDITTSEEVAGAHLVVKEKNSGTVIDEWTSTTSEHIIKNLKAGTYTLTETIAPEGYVKSSTTITFSINSNSQLCDETGSAISKVIMYNEKVKTTGGASISKQDATNGKEVPGAHLVVKDYEGTIIDEWISSNKPHKIENLKPGIYTLTETIAPSGYILSSETVTFTIKDDGSVTPVVMKNAPDSKEVPTGNGEIPTTNQPTYSSEVPVESTGSFKTITSTIIGLVIVAIGSLFITKNIKKNNV